MCAHFSSFVLFSGVMFNTRSSLLYQCSIRLLLHLAGILPILCLSCAFVHVTSSIQVRQRGQNKMFLRHLLKIYMIGLPTSNYVQKN